MLGITTGELREVVIWTVLSRLRSMSAINAGKHIFDLRNRRVHVPPNDDRFVIFHVEMNAQFF